MSDQTDSVVTTGWDKSNHLAAFFTLILLMDLSYHKKLQWRTMLLLMLFYAVAIESLQALIPWRTFSLLDIVFDCAGLAVYAAIRTILWQKINSYFRNLF